MQYFAKPSLLQGDILLHRNEGHQHLYPLTSNLQLSTFHLLLLGFDNSNRAFDSKTHHNNILYCWHAKLAGPKGHYNQDLLAKTYTNLYGLKSEKKQRQQTMDADLM